MKAQDFRIGNLVTDSIGNIIIISNVLDWCVNMNFNEMSGDRVSEIDIEELLPIEITEKILLKCGFEKINKDGVYYALNQIRIDSDFEPFTFDNEGFGWVTIGVKLNHLHQLQNLYYTLIGQELEVNI